MSSTMPPFAQLVDDVTVEAVIPRDADGAAIAPMQASLTADGSHLRAWVPLQTLHIVTPVRMGDGVLVGPGARWTLASAAADQLTIDVTLPDGLTLTSPATTTLPCAALAFNYHDVDMLGSLAPAPQTSSAAIQIAAAQEVAFHARREGPVLARLQATVDATVTVLEHQQGWTRVAYQDAGLVVYGWVDAQHTITPYGVGGGGDNHGSRGRGGRASVLRCPTVTPVRLDDGRGQAQIIGDNDAQTPLRLDVTQTAGEINYRLPWLQLTPTARLVLTPAEAAACTRTVEPFTDTRDY